MSPLACSISDEIARRETISCSPWWRSACCPDARSDPRDQQRQRGIINAFARLPGVFYTRVAPTALPQPYLVAASPSAAQVLGLQHAHFGKPAFIEALTGNRRVAGSDPVAAVYSGHQFGVYVPQLGDGRALLLGEVVGPDGQRWEVQLKGAGRTPYSRMGDGRAVLRSSIREFLVLGGDARPRHPDHARAGRHRLRHPGNARDRRDGGRGHAHRAVFIRFGSFEYFYWRAAARGAAQLADFVIDRFYYPECRSAPQPYLACSSEVARRTARLVAQWQGVGFCHGVMNTDNMSILGLTIDYGPFGFIDAFDAGHVCNHSDDHGPLRLRHAAADRDTGTSTALGQALVPLTDDLDATKAAIDTFSTSTRARSTTSSVPSSAWRVSTRTTHR
jgi:uncharacterized protein YdiU (UPF0061 family)